MCNAHLAAYIHPSLSLSLFLCMQCIYIYPRVHVHMCMIVYAYLGVCHSIYLYHVPGDGQKLPHTGMVIALLIGILLMGM